jgi:hypothetical protein
MTLAVIGHHGATRRPLIVKSRHGLPPLDKPRTALKGISTSLPGLTAERTNNKSWRGQNAQEFGVKGCRVLLVDPKVKFL